MNSASMQVGKSSEDAGRGGVGSDLQVFRLGDVGLIDLPDAPPRLLELHRAVLWEWATSPRGVLIRVEPEDPGNEGTLRAIAGTGELVRRWPGTPIGVVTHSRELLERLGKDPQGRHLVSGETLSDVWPRMWSRGAAENMTIELPPTIQAPRTARETAVRLCREWNLPKLADSIALLTGELVARSVAQGAQDIHFTVSRHHSRVRMLVRDDVPSVLALQPQTIEDVFRVQVTTPALADLTDSFGEFAVDGHHVMWAVARDPKPARRSVWPTAPIPN